MADCWGLDISWSRDSSRKIAQSIKASASKSDGIYNVGKPYKIWVMPSGLDGSWATGTVESYLASAWTYRTIQGSSANAADSYVGQFYETFYRVSNGTSHISNYSTSYTATCPTS